MVNAKTHAASRYVRLGALFSPLAQPADLIVQDEASDFAWEQAAVHSETVLQILHQDGVRPEMHEHAILELFAEDHLDEGPDEEKEGGRPDDMNCGHAQRHASPQSADDHALLFRVELRERNILGRGQNERSVPLRVFILQGRMDEVPQCPDARFSRVCRRIQLRRIVHNCLTTEIVHLVREDSDGAILQGCRIIPQGLVKSKWQEGLFRAEHFYSLFPIVHHALRSELWCMRIYIPCVRIFIHSSVRSCTFV
mmetsp:Transcript_28833/g.81331  ORF Transcript_28833/g.81331 Transcript_28833/m.81331 type:complete len:253 (+) Transcript_28833:3-761(+)